VLLFVEMVVGSDMLVGVCPIARRVYVLCQGLSAYVAGAKRQMAFLVLGMVACMAVTVHVLSS